MLNHQQTYLMLCSTSDEWKTRKNSGANKTMRTLGKQGGRSYGIWSYWESKDFHVANNFALHVQYGPCPKTWTWWPFLPPLPCPPRVQQTIFLLMLQSITRAGCHGHILQTSTPTQQLSWGLVNQQYPRWTSPKDSNYDCPTICSIPPGIPHMLGTQELEKQQILQPKTSKILH